MKILIFNVKFSENLGDGILAMCLERGLMQTRGDIQVETVDIGGRQAFGDAKGGRKLLLRLLELMPAPLRRLAVSAALGRSLPHWKALWQERAKQADFAVIGGGNLFQDDDLNFPLKIGAVLEILRGAGIPVAIHAVGASGNWSLRARKLFASLLGNRVVHVCVRDEQSRQNWRGCFGETFDVGICPDPGLLAAEVLGAGLDHDEVGLNQSNFINVIDSNRLEQDAGRKPLYTFPHPALEPWQSQGAVGICVTHPMILRRHAGMPFSQVPLRSVAGYSDLIRELIGRGYKVLLFTNGAREDQSFLDRIMRDTASADQTVSGRLQAAPRPRDPVQLLGILQPLSAVIAHRLHANIVAYSLRIPHVGLGWDSKVRSFFESVGRERYVVQDDRAPREIAAEVTAAIAQGIDPVLHADQLDEARRGIERLVDKFSAKFTGSTERLPSEVS